MFHRVAWVMVNHNGGGELLATVDSLADDLSAGDTIVLVDNGSGDGSAEQVLALHRNVVLLRNDDNLPFSAASNRGIQYALERDCPWIGLLNPDVRVTPGLTDELVRALEEGGAERVGAVSPVITFGGTDRIWFAGGVILWPLAWIHHRGMGKRRGNAYRYHGFTSYLTGCCWLSPAQAWREVGLLDERYLMYAEDADWSARARAAGWRLRVHSTASLQHNVSSSTKGRFSPVKLYYRTVMGRRFFKFNTPLWARPLQLIGATLMHLVYAAFLLLTGNAEALEAYRRALRLKPTERVKWPPSPKQIVSSS